jgi:hypothetical protein
MICVKCNNNNTKCVDDMLQVGYIAEIYKCNDCGGTIEVQYVNKNICMKNVSTYLYISPEGEQ